MNIEKNNNPVKSRKIIKRCTHSSTISSMYAGENLDTFPMDLINEILKRLPAKTIAICQCVSKQWAFLLGSPHFTKSFLTCSTTRPRLLFTFELGGKWHFFSSPQPRNADEQLITIWVSLEIGIRNCLKSSTDLSTFTRTRCQTEIQSWKGFLCYVTLARVSTYIYLK